MSLVRVIDWLCDHWDQPEEGIWETRGGRKDFTYGRLQCWVALDRALKMATHHGRPGNLTRWTAERDKLYHQIMARGWNPQKGAFTLWGSRTRPLWLTWASTRPAHTR
jgi:GH15 family glucan-1,4-alpha-glucosidase